MNQVLKTIDYSDTTLLVSAKGIEASYPRYMDSIISFDERLSEIKNESTRTTLKIIMSHIENEYTLGVNDKRSINSVEDDMVNYSQKFLYGLANLYIISNIQQRKDIIDTLIASRVQYLDLL